MKFHRIGLFPSARCSEAKPRPPCSRIGAGMTILAAFCAGFVLAETEPNDLLGKATPVPLNGSASAAIDPGKDTDWFMVTVPGPGRLTASIPSPPANMRASMTYYNRNAEYAWLARTAINPGDALDLSMDLTEAGTYFLRVRDANQASAGAYTLHMDFTAVPDANEPNGRVGQATLVSAPPMSGKIFPGGEEDWFRIYATAGDDLSFELNTPAEMRGQIHLYGKNFEYLWASSAAANPGDTALLDYHATETGMIYAKIRDAGNLAHLSGYTLGVTGGTPGYVPPETPATSETEDNDSIGTANRIGLSTTVSGAIAEANDPDWFAFVPTQTGQVTISMDASPANLQLKMSLHNDSGVTILSSRASAVGGLFSMVFDITSLDRHYLRIHSLNENTSPESYQFSSTVVPVSDPFEPNDNYGDRAVLNSVNQIQGWIFPSGDMDWYEIHVSTPGQLRVIVNKLPDNIAPVIGLYNLSRNGIAAVSGTPGTDLELTYPIGVADTYLLRIAAKGSNESTQPYTLTIFGADFTQFAPVATIDSIDPGAIVVGNSVAFTGSGTDADGTVTGYEWTSSIDGALSTLASFSSSALSVGTHTISFRVRDNDGLWSTKAEELLYVGSSVSQETEANDSFFTADELPINQPITAKIDPAGDNDYFKMYVPGPGRFILSLTNVPSNLRMSEYLYNRYWEYLWISAGAVSEGDDVSVTYDATEAGFVYVRLKVDSGQANTEFTYTLTGHFESAADPFEPNGDLLHASLMSSSNVEALFFPTNDYDWYKVWVPTGNSLHAEVDSVPGDVRAAIALYGPNYQYLWKAQDAVNPGDPVSATSDPVPEGAYYYIRVRTLAGTNLSDSYTLTVTGADPTHVPDNTPLTAESEDNNTISKSNPVATGTPVSGTLQPAGDADWFRFDITTPGILHVNADGIPSTVRSQIRIYRNDAAQIASRTASNPGDPLVMDVRITEPGVYHALVNATDGGQESADPYTMTLGFTPVVDPNEPNNHLQEASALSHSNRIQGYLFNVGDTDWFRVHSEDGSTLRVSLGDVPASIRPWIGIYNHDGNQLASKVASNDGQTITLEYAVTETADYSILVRDLGDNSFSSDPYTLAVTGAVFDSYVPLATIDSIVPNPADSGQTVTFTGHGDDPDGSITGYEWRSSIDGVISISQIAETSSLTPGEHTVFFRVRDNDGNWSPDVSTLAYYAVPAPAEEEPNNVAGSATPMDLGKQYTGDMGIAGDYDWFRIHVSQPGQLTIQGSNPVGSAMRLQFHMYTSDLDYAWLSATASNDGDPLSLVWDLTAPGDYYLRLKDYSGRLGGEYTVSANLQAVPDPFEPNPNYANAASINPDDQFQAYAFPTGEQDWYRVDLPTPGALEMSISPVPSDLRMSIAMYDGNLSYLWVAKTANNAGDEVFLTFDAAAAGTYYIRVKPEDGTNNPADPYTFTTQFTPAPDPFEANPSAGHAAWLTQSPVQAYIFPSGDQDWYRVQADPGATLEFTVDQVPDSLRLKLALRNANHGYMWVINTAPNDGDPVTLTYANASGAYYLSVHDADGDRVAGQTYRLSVTGANLDARPPTTPVTEENEPNDSFASPTFIGTDPVTGTFGGNEDWFEFHVTEPSELTMNFTSPSGNRARIVMLNSDMIQLRVYEAENKGEPVTFAYPFGTPGTYYVRLYDADGASSPDSYTLDLNLLPVSDSSEPNNDFASAASVSFGAPIQGMIFPNGDLDWFQVDVTEQGTLTLDLTGVPSNLDMDLNLYNANKQSLGGIRAMHGGDALHLSHYIGTPGIYFVKINDHDNNAYSSAPYTFTPDFIPDSDANEPNSSFYGATVLTGKNQVTGRIDPTGDADWFRFEVDQLGPIRIQIAQTGGIQPRLTLYNDSKASLKAVAAHNHGDSIILGYNITEADTYYLLVQDEGNNQTSTTPYLLTIEGGAFGTHYPIAEMPSFSPNPALIGQNVHLSGQGTDLDGAVVAYEWTSDIDGLIANTATLATSSLSSGRHRIGLRVRDDDGHWSGRVDKFLIIAPEIAQEAEYNNTWQTAVPIPMDQWTTGTINPNGDKDFYKIHADACGLVKILVDATPSAMLANLAVYDAQGNYIWVGDHTSNGGEWLEFGFYASPGWYHVRLTDYHNHRIGTATYAIRCTIETGADPYEPNNSFAEATPIDPDSVLSDPTICASGEYDYYRVDLTQAGRLNLELRNLPATMKGAIDIYNQDLAYAWVSNSSVNGGDSVPLAYDVGSPQSLYVRIKNEWNAAEPQPYELSSVFTPVSDPFEPNNSGGQAALLSASQNHAYIFPGDDVDHYLIWLDAGAVLNMSVTDAPDGMRAQIDMYDENFGYLWISQAANNPGDDIHLSYTAPTDGMYIIRVKDAAGGSYVDSYLLTVTGGTLGYEPPFAPQTVEAEGNGTFPTATDIALGTDVSGQTTPNGDNDYFRIHVTQAGVLTVSHTSIPDEITSEMWVYNNDHGQVGYRRETNPGDDNILELAIVDPGYYYIRLRDYENNNSSTDIYTLRASLTPVIDPNEPNNSFGVATTLGGDSVSAWLFPGTDNDYYRVYVRNPGPLSISLDTVPTANRPHLYLYDSNLAGHGGWVNTNPGIGGSDLIVYTVPSPGFYYIRVRDEDGHYSADPYTLRITGADFSAAPLLAPIGDRSLDETVPHAFTITATDPDNPEDLVFSATNLPPGASFDPATRTFSWTPTRGQAGTYAGVHFEVSDGAYTDSEDITLTVVALDQPPVLDPVGNKQGYAETELSFQISGSDPDAGDTLTFSADNLPSGAVFDPATRTFAWTPATNQIRTHLNILFRVTDGERTDFEYIDIEISAAAVTYELWLEDHFTEAERSDPAISGLDADPDADGASNGEEFDADTDPRDRNSILRVTDLVLDLTGTKIDWQGGVESIQILERKFDLGDGSIEWEVLQTVNPPTPATNTFHDPSSGHEKAFYRLRAQRP